MNLGVRELRDGLSRYLAEVRAGRSLTVTDRGVPIARLVPVDRPTRMEVLIAEGRVRPARDAKKPIPAPLRTDGPVSDLVSDQRR